ncbi:MAG: Fic family protein [Deltaproteobacteria bacterium]|nr:Fic family protein [Deltaproteobacteria bacterium]
MDKKDDKEMNKLKPMDLVKKVMTLKSGKFVFSRRHSDKRIFSLLLEFRVLYKTVNDLPILPQLAAHLEKELVRRSIFGTAALEGNPLTEREVEDIVSKHDNIKSTKTTKQAEREIHNLKDAYDFVARLQSSGHSSELDETTVKQLHEVVTKDIEYKNNAPGQYRNYVVKVGDIEHGGVYTPPKCRADIAMLMSEFMSWINSEEVVRLPVAKRAALAHYHLALIHPFGDGNGRTARLVEALVLRLGGIKYVPEMLSNFYYRNIDDYFRAFSVARKDKRNDVTPFLEFVFKGIVESLNEIKERITYFIRVLALRDYYVYLQKERLITQRQHDFLIMLLENRFGPFTARDMFTVSPFVVLYRSVSERTAKRDLKKLSGENLWLLDDLENGQYELNLGVLG